MRALAALEEIERRLIAAMRAGDEAVIQSAAHAITCLGLGDPLPDGAYRIRDVAPELWCTSCDRPTANPSCPHSIDATRRKVLDAYRGVPPWLVVRMEGKLEGLARVLVPDGAAAILKIAEDRVRHEWAADSEVTIEVRIRQARP